jgi:hypothetical protein
MKGGMIRVGKGGHRYCIKRRVCSVDGKGRERKERSHGGRGRRVKGTAGEAEEREKAKNNVRGGERASCRSVWKGSIDKREE